MHAHTNICRGCLVSVRLPVPSFVPLVVIPLIDFYLSFCCSFSENISKMRMYLSSPPTTKGALHCFLSLTNPYVVCRRFSFLLLQLDASIVYIFHILFAVFALLDFSSFHLLLLQVELQRVALYRSSVVFLPLCLCGRFLRIRPAAQRTDRPVALLLGIALSPLTRVWAISNLTASLESACIVTPSPSRICCQNVGFLLVLLVENCISILICISFYYEEVGDHFMSFKGFCILFLWLSLSLASFAVEVDGLFPFLIKGRSQDFSPSLLEAEALGRGPTVSAF